MSKQVRSIACALLTGVSGELLLQRRDDIPGIVFPGRIGLFGGHVESGETFLEAVRREIREETTLDLSPEAFQPLVQYQTRYPDGMGVDGAFFHVGGVTVDPAKVSEGQLKVVVPEEAPAFYEEMTPATCFVIKTFLETGTGEAGHRKD